MDDMLVAVESNFTGILSGISIIVALIGFVMASMGLYLFATAGSNRGSSTHGYGGATALIIAGAMLLNLTGTVQTTLNSVYGEQGAYSTALGTESSQLSFGGTRTQQWIEVIFAMLVVLGWISSARGLMHLGFFKSGREHGIKSGIILLACGAILTNPYGLAQSIGVTFGVQNSVNLIIPPPP